MSDDNTRDLFDKVTLPPVNELAKRRAKQAAMAAFRDEMKKNSEIDQGNSTQARPTHKSTNVRKNKMTISTKKIWFSGLAACCMITIGTLSFNESLKVKGIPSIKDVSNEESYGKTAPVMFDTDASIADPSAPKSVAAERAEALVERKVEEQVAQKKENSDFSGAATNDMPSRRMAEDKAVASSQNAAVVMQSPGAQQQIKPASVTMAKVQLQADANQSIQLEDRNNFKVTSENAVQNPKTNPVSTFSIDVDTASYSFMRRQLNRGVLPPKDSVRLEELVNYFDYDYPLPKDKSQPFEPTIVVGDSPWRKGNKLIHIGIKGYEIPKDMQPDSNLVFLLDVSGSMNSPDRLPLVKQSMGLLLDTLKPTDTVAIVVYAGAAGAVLEPTQVKNKDKILAALNQLNAGGSTAGGAGLTLAYDLAQQNFKKQAVNRIILATDGDFNVGVTQDERLEDFVKHKRDAGIYLSVLGFGEGNYQDALMQTLAQNGNGIAAYIDTLSEAQKVLVQESTSSLFPIANDVKIQVEFNPAMVSEYRLLGYETRALKREDFNNDKVDAGDIGAGHTVTAIYEITPVGAESGLIDDLRYKKNAQNKTENQNDGSGEYGFLKLRYKLPGENTSKLITKAITVKNSAVISNTLKQGVDFATAVGGFAQILKGSDYVQNYTYDDVINLAQSNKGDDAFGYRTEFVQLVRRAKLAKQM